MVFKKFLVFSFAILRKKDLVTKCLRLSWKWFEGEGRCFAIGWRRVEWDMATVSLKNLSTVFKKLQKKNQSKSHETQQNKFFVEDT